MIYAHIPKPQKADPDPVNHPPHYQGKYECIDVLEDLGLGHAFCIGNCIKYLWRAGKKGDLLEDLKKAQWYLNRAIEALTQPTV